MAQPSIPFQKDVVAGAVWPPPLPPGISYRQWLIGIFMANAFPNGGSAETAATNATKWADAAIAAQKPH